MSFVSVVLEELNDEIEAKIKYNAIAHRVSRLENDEFQKYIKENETSKKIVVDHEEQLKQYKQG